MRPSGLRPKCSGVRVSPVKRSTVTRSNGMLQLPQQDPGLHAVPRSGMVVQDHPRNLACRMCGEEWQQSATLVAGLVGGAATAHGGGGGAGGRLDHDRPPARPAERINVLTVDPGRVRGVLSNERIAGRERVSAMARRVRAVAGVNGGFFAPSGDPVGVLAIDGELLSEPVDGRSALLPGPGGGSAGRSRRLALQRAHVP